MKCLFSGCLVVVACCVSYVLANTTRCYSCNGKECNDPFVRSAAVIMNCSTLNFAKSVNANDDWDAFDRLFQNFQSVYSTYTDYGCVKYSYEQDGANQNLTIRRCVPKKIENVDACAAISTTTGLSLGKINFCTMCDSDLCNSSTTLNQSLLAIVIVGIIKMLF